MPWRHTCAAPRAPRLQCRVKGFQGLPGEMRSFPLEAAAHVSQPLQQALAGARVDRHGFPCRAVGSGGSRVLWMLELSRKACCGLCPMLEIQLWPRSWGGSGGAQAVCLLSYPGLKKRSVWWKQRGPRWRALVHQQWQLSKVIKSPSPVVGLLLCNMDRQLHY